MSTFFISDIHGNLPALKKCLSFIPINSNLYVLGDVVNYGPWSNECVDILLKRKKTFFIRGNHENYFIKGFPKFNKKYFNNKLSYNLVKCFYEFCIKNFKRHATIEKYLNNLTFEDFICKHTINDKKIFSDTVIKISHNYIIGHSHQQFLNKINKNIIVNPGSVGQNRENINEISFCEYTSDKFFIFHNLNYDSDILINKMKELDYPDICIDYYNKKK